jgi:prepilin-type N-terminal cleavage/methylation domain-containing protein
MKNKGFSAMAGFTLVELLVVLSLIFAFSAGITTIFYSVSRHIVLQSTAETLATDIRTTQSRARLQHQACFFDAEVKPLPQGVKIASAHVFSFCASGFPPPGGSGTLVLQNSSGERKSVIVSSVGRVRVE